MIEFRHVYKNYAGGVSALKDISFTVERGEFVFFTGPSGAGKTTLFRLVSAYDKPTSGHVHVANFNVHELNNHTVAQLRRRIGVVFQDFRLLKDRNIFYNIALPLEICGEPPEFIRRRVHEMLELVGLRFREENYPEQLSGGEQQRVAIARALVHRPMLVIADEPTGNLDSELSREIMDLFEKVHAQGTTVFLATHDTESINQRQRRVIRVKDGLLAGDGAC